MIQNLLPLIPSSSSLHPRDKETFPQYQKADSDIYRSLPQDGRHPHLKKISIHVTVTTFTILVRKEYRSEGVLETRARSKSIASPVTISFLNQIACCTSTYIRTPWPGENNIFGRTPIRFRPAGWHAGHSVLAEGMRRQVSLAGKSYIIPAVSDVYMHAARIYTGVFTPAGAACCAEGPVRHEIMRGSGPASSCRQPHKRYQRIC